MGGDLLLGRLSGPAQVSTILLQCRQMLDVQGSEGCKLDLVPLAGGRVKWFSTLWPDQQGSRVVRHGVNGFSTIMLLGAGSVAAQGGSSFSDRRDTHSRQGVVADGVQRLPGLDGEVHGGHWSYSSWIASALTAASQPDPVMLVILCVSTGTKTCLNRALVILKTEVMRGAIE